MPKPHPFLARLLAKALSYPGSHEDHPWGETVAKVKGKVFLFTGGSDGGLSLSVKIPSSAGAALMLPFASPTEYGLGKSGWITARFAKGDQVPEGLLVEWLDESYRAVAPVKLVKELDERGQAVPLAKKPGAKKPAPKKPAAKKPAAKKPAVKKPAAKKR